MKHTLTISVTDEDGGYRGLIPYLFATRVFAFLDEWEDEMRRITKHGTAEEQATTWGDVRERWYQLKNECGVVDGE